ncbi:MAG: pantoate--beta-alanine ligase [Bacteroidia bacterium]|nr:pantoate--beta-alanine ligase [Bacteroidia bacterium]
MIVFKTIKTLQTYLNNQKGGGKSIGFVPTMGALHQGHISLILKSKAETDLTISSIFVNPTQFNNPSDLEKYPRTASADMKLLASVKCDVLFMPNVLEMYPNGQVKNTEDYGEITHVLEGEKRPGHFDGVITIVARLFEIIEPTKTFFGQKDYQQCMVVQELIKRHFPKIELKIEPTVRQLDGLALSSRNARLSEGQQKEALNISKAMFFVKENWGTETIENLIASATEIIETNKSLTIEYFQVCNKTSLKALNGSSQNQEDAVILTAVFCGDIRLIDNLIV